MIFCLIFPHERSEFLNFRQKIFTTNLADLARFADTIHAFTCVWCVSAPFDLILNNIFSTSQKKRDISISFFP